MGVDEAYLSIKDEVDKEVTKQVRNIDITSIKNKVINKAKDEVVSQVEDKIDELIDENNDKLKAISRVYDRLATNIGGKDTIRFTF